MLPVLDIQTELLILAHLCYSGVCNMEGISNVLRAARVMTVWMEKEGEFSNMVSIQSNNNDHIVPTHHTQSYNNTFRKQVIIFFM